MRSELYSLNVPTTQTTGTPFPARNLRDKSIQLVGIAGGGVAKVEGTIDGSTWVAASGGAGNISADGVYAITETFDLIRINRSTLGTGTWTATLNGYNVRAGG